MPDSPPKLRLKKGEDRRLRAGHLWVFSNEIDTAATPLNELEPGDEVLLTASHGKPLGTAYVNPNSLIAARIMSRNPDDRIDHSLLAHRINVAAGLRDRYEDAPYYRAVFAESDRLPGLVVDRYGNVLVGQITTAGMARRQDLLTELLVDKYRPEALLWRNDSPIRDLEGLPREIVVGHGDMPERLQVRESGTAFSIAAGEAQKTGWFYDQRANRDRCMRYVSGRRVLDLFAYVGAWGLRAAVNGAEAVTCVDSGAQAIADMESNARGLGLTDAVRLIRSDVFQYLEQALADGERFDVVIVDPPAFAKRKKDAKAAIQAYRKLNEMALRLLDRDGILATCSCSYHLRQDVFFDVVNQAARHVDRNLQLLERLQQAPDHPVHPAIPETDYLKGGIFRSTLT